MHIDFDNNGNPSALISSRAIVSFANPTEVPSKTSVQANDTETVGKFKYIPWYDGNDFPAKVITNIQENPVLKRAIIMHVQTTVGQGLVPARTTELKLNGDDTIEIVTEPEITKLLQNYIIRRYVTKAAYDLYAFGNAFVKLTPNVAGNQILQIATINAKHCRITEADKDGKSQTVIVSGNWETPEIKNTTDYILLDEIDPLGHLLELKSQGKLTKPVVMKLSDDFSSNDYYSEPAWYSAKKWIDIAKKVAKAIDAGMDNMLNIYIHLKIPYSYWEKKYPTDKFTDQNKRKAKIESDLRILDEKLTTAENSKKALITFFGDSDSNEDKWELDIIDKKFNQEDFVKSTAADTQTAIGVGIMPDLLGLMYGNSKGGSMQRELLLIQYALSWTDRQKLADPLELMLQFNFGDKYSDVQLMFKNTFLTPLSSGSGSQTQIS